MPDTIFAGLADDIDVLDTSLPSADMVLKGGARAYTNNGLAYFGNVHYRPFNESWMMHENIQRTILRSEAYQGHLYAGTAGSVNIDYIAATKAPGAILYDVNPWQKLFWDQFFEVMAMHDNPDDFAWAMEHFAADFYLDLSKEFDVAAVRQSQLDNGQPAIDINAPEIDKYGYYVSDYSSPFRGDGYKNFGLNFRTAAGHPDTGWSYGRSSELNWMRDMNLYGHLHQLAKERAIGSVTLDISDEAACKELSEALQRRSLKVGFLYTSNIGHYMQWSQREIEGYKKERGEDAMDFRGKPVSVDMWARTCENLRMFCKEDAYVLNFDQHNGVDGWTSNFYPAFYTKSERVQIPTALDPGGLI